MPYEPKRSARKVFFYYLQSQMFVIRKNSSTNLMRQTGKSS